MAKQKGFLPIEGTLGNITYYKLKEGHFLKRKSSISAHRFANDPAFERARENNREFGKSVKAAKLFHTAFRSVILIIADFRLFSRLVQGMLKIVKNDTLNPKGQRRLLYENVKLIEGFNFNKNTTLENTFFVPFTITIDKAKGISSIELPAFVPIEMVVAPKGATHFRIVFAIAGIDFEKGQYATDNCYSDYWVFSSITIPPIKLDLILSDLQPNPWFICVGITFYQEGNKIHYSSNNGVCNAMAVVKVGV